MVDGSRKLTADDVLRIDRRRLTEFLRETIVDEAATPATISESVKQYPVESWNREGVN